MTRRLALLLTVVALLASGCGSRVRQEEWDSLTAQDGAPTSPALRGEPGSGTTASDESTATTTAHSRTKAAASTATIVAGALPAPADGTYTYDETQDGDTTSTSERWTAQRQADAVTVTSVVTEDDDGDTVKTTDTYRVTRHAFELLSEESAYAGEDPDTCTYKPPVLVLQLPLTTGDKWKTTPTCADADAGDGETTSIAVTGRATDVVGGQSVATYVVRGTETFSSTDDTTGERTTFTFTDTRHVDPATLLVVVEDITFTAAGHANTVHRQLRSLTPT
ncbi:MAG TPA: hypothetical protein VHC63_12860 [Acidimicrobiales bacterium]|nr:hypothetical protein [Acidimicrobiales bacterium]